MAQPAPSPNVVDISQYKVPMSNPATPQTFGQPAPAPQAAPNTQQPTSLEDMARANGIELPAPAPAPAPTTGQHAMPAVPYTVPVAQPDPNVAQLTSNVAALTQTLQAQNQSDPEPMSLFDLGDDAAISAEELGRLNGTQDIIARIATNAARQMVAGSIVDPLNQQFQQLHAKDAQFDSRIQQSAARSTEAALLAAVPNWKTLMADRNFTTRLQNTMSPSTGRSLAAEAADAFDRGDVGAIRTMVYFLGGGTPAPQPHMQPAQVAYTGAPQLATPQPAVPQYAAPAAPQYAAPAMAAPVHTPYAAPQYAAPQPGMAPQAPAIAAMTQPVVSQGGGAPVAAAPAAGAPEMLSAAAFNNATRQYQSGEMPKEQYDQLYALFTDASLNGRVINDIPVTGI